MNASTIAQSTMTRKGQITVPAEVRRLLSLEKGDRVVFVVENDDVRLARAGSAIAQTAGMLKTTQSPQTAEQVREETERAIAEEAIARTQR